jgi:hypothetical protein
VNSGHPDSLVTSSNHRKEQVSHNVERLPMEPNEFCASNPHQSSESKLAYHESHIFRAQPWLGRRSPTFGSNDVTVLSGNPSQPIMESHAPHLLHDNKVAIPRGSNPRILTSNKRISRACDSCREQKAKCSGHHPACQRCRESDTMCIYTDRKRDRDAKLVV